MIKTIGLLGRKDGWTHEAFMTHWVEVHFARMDNFVPVLSLSEEEYKTAMNIRVIDTGVSSLHKEFIKWLKDNIVKK